MPITIWVDANPAEKALFEALQEACRQRGLDPHGVKRGRLDLGDVRVRSHLDEELVFERKSIADWAASIRDGRYHEQKQRFLQTQSVEAPSQLVYIIEGDRVPDFDGHTGGIANRSLNAALLMTQLRDGIAVIHSQDTRHSADAVLYVANRLGQGALNARPAKDLACLDSSARKRKRENLDDPRAALRAMLCALPGISQEKATALVEAFPTLRRLSNATPEAIANVKAGAAKRRIGSALAARLAGLTRP